jgi:hypothetical protein
VESFRRAFVILATAICWIVLGLQLILTIGAVVERGGSAFDGLLRALDYFTVLTNILVAVVLAASLYRRASGTMLVRPRTMAAAALYIAVVGIVYALLLRDLWEPTGLQLVADIGLHEVVPILFMVFWLAFVPKGTLRWTDPIWWLIYPIVYFIYALLRGAWFGRYPYPFIDVNLHGYAGTLSNAVLLLAVFFGLGSLLVLIDHRMSRIRGAVG